MGVKVRSLQPPGDYLVDGVFPRSHDRQCRRRSDGEDMKFEAFASLLSKNALIFIFFSRCFNVKALCGLSPPRARRE